MHSWAFQSKTTAFPEFYVFKVVKFWSENLRNEYSKY